MLIIMFSILTIVNGLVLEIPIKFILPEWMNNSDSLESFFSEKYNESYIYGTSKSTCVIFSQKESSLQSIGFETKCIDGCRIKTLIPSEYCPLSGSVSQIVFHLDNTLADAFYIIVKGCFFDDEQKNDVYWYISNKPIIDLEKLKIFPNVSFVISDTNFMKCSVLCSAYDCYGDFKIELFFFSVDESKQMFIVTIGGGILCLVVLCVIAYFIKNLIKK